MEQPAAEASFAGSVPEIYDRHLVPMIFDHYAVDLAERVSASGGSTVLELAAGTGVVTRRMAAVLPPEVSLTSTDLSPAMIERAQRIGTARPVEWQVTDAMALPFADDSFDAVVCQFGVMFFPDRVEAYRGVGRVLRSGGAFLFNAWGPLDRNDFAAAVLSAVADLHPDDPPTFLQRIPHGYHDEAQIRADLAAAGFTSGVEIEHVDGVSRAATAYEVALAYCHGTPMRNFLDARGPVEVDRATEAAAAAIARTFGDRDLEGRINALVVTAPAPEV
jgi:SAM-dependent methyltransferase